MREVNYKETGNEKKDSKRGMHDVAHTSIKVIFKTHF